MVSVRPGHTESTDRYSLEVACMGNRDRSKDLPGKRSSNDNDGISSGMDRTRGTSSVIKKICLLG